MTDVEHIVRRARKPKGSGYLVRDEILAVAEEVFLTHGYDGATIRRIALAAGVSPTAVYMHFRDKGELLLEIARKSISELIDRNERLAAREKDPGRRVEAMLRAYMDFALVHPHAYQLVFGQPLPLSEERLDDVRALGAHCFELFLEAVEALASAGRVRGDVVVAAQVAWAAAHGIVSLQINHPAFAWAEGPEKMTRATVDYLFHGLLAEGREPAQH